MLHQIKTNIIRPQKGYQMKALASSADIVIGGAAAGVGKTFSLLLEPLRHLKTENFGAVIFRRTTPQIRNEGGLWDASAKLYSLIDRAVPKQTFLEWHFEKDIKFKFSHLEHEKNVYDWQGAEIPLIGFDELPHFSKQMFFYMLSRNRSTCGVTPYVRATCNPDPDSWVAELIDWWIAPDGFPIKERRGKIRYFLKDGDTMIWANTKEECIEKGWYFLQPLAEKSGFNPDIFVKSLTFISGSIYENKALLEKDPQYLANLAAQDEDTRRRLLEGNWKVSVNPQDVYNYNVFKDFFTNTWVEGKEKCITVDAAMSGADKLIISYFNGNRLEDMVIMAKSTGKDIIDGVETMQHRHHVPNSRVVYDADGVGAFIGGHNAFISGAVAFHNNSKARYNSNDRRQFKNLKAQCYYLDGEDANQYISEHVANTMYDDKMTVRQRFLYERKAIKKAVKMDEEPFSLIKKDEMKQKYLAGDSPDIMDGFMMKRIFSLGSSWDGTIDWD